MNDYTEEIKTYIKMEEQVLKHLPIKDINMVMNVLEEARLSGRRIFICGNGGSASTASHYECDFNKGVSYDQEIKYDFECLSDNVPMMMSEDMYNAKKIIDAGYKKGYVATAVVEHSHKMKLKQLYERYYETGKWFKEHPEFDGYKTTDTGMKLAFSVLGQALKHFNIPVLFRWLPDMTARYLGMKKGKSLNE